MRGAVWISMASCTIFLHCWMLKTWALIFILIYNWIFCSRFRQLLLWFLLISSLRNPAFLEVLGKKHRSKEFPHNSLPHSGDAHWNKVERPPCFFWNEFPSGNGKIIENCKIKQLTGENSEKQLIKRILVIKWNPKLSKNDGLGSSESESDWNTKSWWNKKNVIGWIAR